MPTWRWVLVASGLAGLAGLAGAAGAADPPYYIRKADWQETMRASREALKAHEAKLAAETAKAEAASAQAAKAEPVEAQPAGAGGKLKLGPWHEIGPFTRTAPPATDPAASSFAVAFPPEKEVSLTASHDKLKWRRITAADGEVHKLNCPSDAAIYFYRTITAAQATKATGYFGSDDGLAVWLNGKKIISNPAARGVGPNQDSAVLDLQAGVNHLLIKIWNRSGDCGWYFSTSATSSPSAGSGRASDPRDLARAGLWELVRRDFPSPGAARQMTWEQEDGIWADDWPAGDVKALAARYASAVRGSSQSGEIQALFANTANTANTAGDADLAKVRQLYYAARLVQESLAKVKDLNNQALRLAIEDLMATFGPRYPRGPEFLKRLAAMERSVTEAAAGASADKNRLVAIVEEFEKLRREALLANPLLDFDKLLVVKRGLKSPSLGLPQNWQGNCALARSGYDDEIAVLSPIAPEGRLTTLHRPDGTKFVGDVDLHFDGNRLLFSSIDAGGRFQIYQIGADGRNLRQVTPSDKDVDNYDACYLPDGRIIFGSTRCFQGVPCVGGGNSVANLYITDADGGNTRQLTFEQDHDWCPTVMHDGRVMYTRWEYSDTPHYFSRLLFNMNPDGTQQMELYGSNSYWPNSTFYARPCPGHPTRVIAVISGHHGVARMGELILFDPAKGRHEADGVVQRIPGYGKKVEPIIRDGLVDASWPKFLHPYPLSDKYFLVSCKRTAQDGWDLYLVDVFDNMLPLRTEPGYALLEPVPLRRTPRPPAIPDKVNLARKDAIVYLADIYAGPGLKGVPRGTVKQLRLYAFHYAYYRMGGHINIGVDGPWDVHRILGTVPVQPDGSAMFRVPANTPIALQPLDAGGKALQLMRSWLTAMPGEFLSCVGCHEKQSDTVAMRYALAPARQPDEIAPWRGPARGFSFPREVQPVLDKYCVSCHNGQKQEGKDIPDFRCGDGGRKGPGGFTPSYLALHPYVRRPGPESDYHMMPPLEYHADSSELVQMLQRGHGRVQLDAEAWDRLITWIDLNVPDHGTWSEHQKIAGDIHQRRLEMAKLYAGIAEDPEQIVGGPAGPAGAVQPAPPKPKPAGSPVVPGWPFDAAEANRRQQAAGTPPQTAIDLGDGLKLDLVLIPPGEFVMGDVDGWEDEWPLTRLRIGKSFWMGKFEITNEQYRLFDPAHDSRYISWYNKDQDRRGEPASNPRQPVIRITWQQAMAFCQWLSQKTGRSFSLPTEAQWEYACRAGTAIPLYYGDGESDFSRFANLADKRITELCRRDSHKWIPSVQTVSDGSVVTDNVGKYQPNAWGLCDMHGNAAEWTRTTYRPYPYDGGDGRDNATPDGRKVVRGGSFYDRPKRARSAFRLSYPSWQQVYSVGFRAVCEDGPDALAGRAAK